MSSVDEPWAIERLEYFIHLTRLINPNSNNTYGLRARPAGGRSAILEAIHTTEQILDRVLPRWRSEIPEDTTNRWQQQHQAAQRAVVQLRDGAEIAARLGDNSPVLSASNLHPWVWEGARSLWQSGHFREAVRAASVKVNAETQNKLHRRDISETDLFKQALSNDPPTGSAHRLRPAGDDGGRTSLSLRRGIMAFAEGCYAGIRNPASHDEGDLDEQAALEQLAALSVLARWVDEASVVTP
ncbi:restriction endonuclease [Microbacterium maritypicum]|uniref:Restriction endonuclease n=1 Tax=Microbacterium maritypicum TaxID=33918 RepID=A0AAD3X272_MICMQ|nr:restriction endonuclease [Microbacterium liquefaciens]